MNAFAYRRQQRGVVLAVSLILLLLLTILAITASTSSTLQERMAANAQDDNIAFQATESALASLNTTLIGGGTVADDGFQTMNGYTNKNVRTRIQTAWRYAEGTSLDVESGTPVIIIYDFTSSTSLDPNVTTAAQINDDNTYARHLQGYRDRIIQ